MAQWVNRLWNNISVNPPPLPLLCEISGAIHLAQPGLTAGWWQARRARRVGGWAGGRSGGQAGGQAGRQAGRQGRRNAGEFQNF